MFRNNLVAFILAVFPFFSATAAELQLPEGMIMVEGEVILPTQKRQSLKGVTGVYEMNKSVLFVSPREVGVFIKAQKQFFSLGVPPSSGTWYSTGPRTE